uniref:PiggyBac transposable element-derived protein domain-containing protein n=1 Tax=Clastoptera arizonana TaxID=38151 RepID=A0A1B6D991_9HEMI
MVRDRFLEILRCLYFSHVTQSNTNNTQPSTTRQAPCSFTEKIDEIVFYFNNKMAQIYYSNQELSIDESMFLWRGRLRFHQYFKGKRHKFEVKLYSLNEPDGLTSKFKIYAGAGDETVGLGHTEMVVMLLLNRLLNNGHSVFMNNYYNSFSLASKLLHMNTYCTGTLRRNRKCNPKETENAKLKKGETTGKYAEGVLIGKWRDKRDVMYI